MELIRPKLLFALIMCDGGFVTFVFEISF
jgi:hypothetical protein